MIELLSHNQIATSMFDLEANSFDIQNYRSAGAPANATMDSDTNKGVLGGSVASLSGEWEAAGATHNDGNAILGLFAKDSEGAAYENKPAVASGKVAIFQDGGLFLLYTFETNQAEGAFGDLVAGYALGGSLYVSPFGLLTSELPSAHSSAGTDNVVATITKVPTSTELEMGIHLKV